MAANDNWRDSQQELLQATPIPPTNDYESAIVATLDPGAYTVILKGFGLTTGVGLVEVYDLDLQATSKLANISTRGYVDRGDNVLIGGMIVTGGDSTTVLFRALGPSLSGLTNALRDTTLELHDGNGALVAINDNWKETQRAEIEATQIPPRDDRESAIIRSLTPGAYTAVVRGKGDLVGLALIEAYQVN